MYEITTYTVSHDKHNWRIKVQATNHAQKRFTERNIDVDWYVLAADIMSIGDSIINRLERDICVVDQKHDLALIIEVTKVAKRECEVNIITILDKADCFVKNGTEVHRLR
jgi:hypothetical protein